MKANYIAILAGILSVVACNVKEESFDEPLGVVSFHAVNGDAQDTKTLLQSNGTLLWSAKDKIDIFVGTQSFEFTGTNDYAVSEATFTGSLGGVDWSSGKEYWAVYPHSADNVSDGTSITVSLPAEQEACAGTFANNLFISIAKSQDYNLSFYNVCGGIKFSVTETGVKSVTFRGNNGEAIAGTAKVAFDQNGKPIVQEITNPLSEVTLSAPAGTTLEVGKWYYIVCFPTVLENGYVMSLNKADGSVGEKIGDSSVSIKRAVWGRLAELDKNLFYSIPLNEIWYTSVNDVVVNPYSECEWIKNDMIVSNIVSDGIGRIVFKDDITEICDHAFYNCTSLTSIIIPESVNSIQKYAFYYCNSLASIKIPDSVKSIGDYAFYYCRKLASIKIPDSVTSIGVVAFYCCNSLTSIIIPDGVNYISAYTFYNCYSLTSIIIPDSVTSIGDYAFSDCTNLTSITIPDNVTSIGGDAFYNCTSLTSIIIPDSVKYIREYAFYNCTGLTSIVIPDSVTSIAQYAFSYCTNLTSITIPHSVTNIGEKAFYECRGLTSIFVNATVPPTGAQGMFESTNNCPIYVPIGSLDAYKASWGEYSSRLLAIPPEAIDLGLSVKWASCNLGATVPNGYGDYYAWGEKDTKSSYNWSNYKWCDGSADTITKYNIDDSYGTVDNNAVLNASDDVVRVKLGGKWRIPTSDDWEELMSNCSMEYKYKYGSYGWLVTSNINGASIFLPFPGIKEGDYFNAAGNSGSYWSSSLYMDDPCKASYVRIDNNSFQKGTLFRNCGVSLRPVYGDFINVSAIQLTKSKLDLLIFDTESLSATILPENATFKTIIWSSSNKRVATVDNNGIVAAIGEGSATITAYATDGSGKYATCVVTVSARKPVPEAVDLGLSVKWASFNLGANKPEEYGDYYAWGETEPYYIDGHSQDNPCSNWRNGKEEGYDYDSNIWHDSYYGWTKYNFTDHKTVLEVGLDGDDAAYIQLGRNWRIPTKEECKELIDNCSIVWSTLNGVDGIKLTSLKAGYTDKWIFLPASGYRQYLILVGEESVATFWSSSFCEDATSNGAIFAWSLFYEKNYDFSLCYGHRWYGFPIRPVTE